MQLRDFIYYDSPNDYASFVLAHYYEGGPALSAFLRFAHPNTLWCTYKGERKEVVGIGKDEHLLFRDTTMAPLAELSDWSAYETDPSVEVTDDPSSLVHVDDFTDDSNWQDNLDPYAVFVLNHMRRPAINKYQWSRFMDSYPLFCNYKGVRHRITMASRFGDVGITTRLDHSSGYEERVYVNELSHFSPHESIL